MTVAYQSWKGELLVGSAAVVARRSGHIYPLWLNGLAAVGLGLVPVGLIAAIWSAPAGAAFAVIGFILIHVTGSLAEHQDHHSNVIMHDGTR